MSGNAKSGKMVFILSDKISSSLPPEETRDILVDYCAYCVCNGDAGCNVKKNCPVFKYIGCVAAPKPRMGGFPR